MITVGDALGPRLMEAAFSDGFNAARQLEKDWQRPTWVRFSTGSAV